MKQKWFLEEVPSNEFVQNRFVQKQAFLKRTEKPQQPKLSPKRIRKEQNKDQRENKIGRKKQIKNNKTKNWFSERANKIENGQAHWEEKRENLNKQNKTWKRKNSQLIPQKYKKTIREYCEQLYGNKFNNIEEMDKFLETHSPTKLSREQ